MENTRQAGIGIKVPTANARTSDRLASVMDGPTSTSALLIRSSRSNSNGCRFTACTSIHILSTPTWYNQVFLNIMSLNKDQNNVPIINISNQNHLLTILYLLVRILLTILDNSLFHMANNAILFQKRGLTPYFKHSLRN